MPPYTPHSAFSRLSGRFVVFLLFTALPHYSQVLSQFSWNSNPVTTADIGPNATSVSGSAISSAGGVGGTNGLNAGLPTADINLVIPTGSGIFDVNGIDVSIDYQRDENVGNLFVRGSSLIMTGGSNLSVSYRVDNGAGGFNTVNSGNVFAIPNDNTYRTYRFVYLPTTGLGALYVNGVSVWSNDGPDNRGMYWTGSGNIIIGQLLDGASQNQAFLDNLVVGSVTNSPLPVELLEFEAGLTQTQEVELRWKTASENENSHFMVERSQGDGFWQELGRVEGQGNSRLMTNYLYNDLSPLKGTSYYRLKQVDFDGSFHYSGIRSVALRSDLRPNLKVYPNPTKGECVLEAEIEEFSELKVFDQMGRDLSEQVIWLELYEKQLRIDLSTLHPGCYVLVTKNAQARLCLE